MRRSFITLFALLLLLIPTTARAQGAVTFDTLTVRLWPEYDQPSMLVIHEFMVTEDTVVPTAVDIRIPHDANITAVAYESAGDLLLANYQTKTTDDANWQVITLFITERAPYRVEYYQPLERNGNTRSFAYQWTGNYAVNNFNMEIQIPGDSTNVKTTPAIPLTQKMPFLGGGATMNGLKESQTYRLQLEYARESETAIATPASTQVEAVTPVDENTDGRSTLNNLPMFLGGFGVLLIAGGLFYFLRGQGGVDAGKPRKRRRAAQGTDSQTYCHECGMRAHEGDRFCRACGSKFRVS